MTLEDITKNRATVITEIKAKDGKLYISAIFDCFDLTVLGLAIDDNTGGAVRADTEQRGGGLSGAAGCHRPLRPRLPIHLPRLPGDGGKVRHLSEHEQ